MRGILVWLQLLGTTQEYVCNAFHLTIRVDYMLIVTLITSDGVTMCVYRLSLASISFTQTK